MSHGTTEKQSGTEKGGRGGSEKMGRGEEKGERTGQKAGEKNERTGQKGEEKNERMGQKPWAGEGNKWAGVGKPTIFVLHSGTEQCTGTVLSFTDDAIELTSEAKEQLQRMVPLLRL